MTTLRTTWRMHHIHHGVCTCASHVEHITTMIVAQYQILGYMSIHDVIASYIMRDNSLLDDPNTVPLVRGLSSGLGTREALLSRANVRASSASLRVSCPAQPVASRVRVDACVVSSCSACGALSDVFDSRLVRGVGSTTVRQHSQVVPGARPAVNRGTFLCESGIGPESCEGVDSHSRQ